MKKGQVRKGRTSVLVGSKGSGKSFEAKKRANSKKNRVLVWDAVGEWEEDRLFKKAAYFESLYSYLDHSRNGGLQPRRLVLAASHREWIPFLDFAYKSMAASGGGTVVIEEINRYVGARNLAPAWLDMVDRSRHACIDLLLVTPRVMAIPVELRNQIDEWTFTQSSDPDLLKDIRSRFDAATAEKVRNLKQYELLTPK